MLKFLIFLPIQILTMLLGYLTNWIVVLFANEDGELKGIFKLWQTWDDSIDNKEFIRDTMPKIFKYDYDKYNIEYQGLLPQYGRKRWYTKNIRRLPLKDKIKRYFCRVGWLNRNCAYGFAFYLLGTWVDNHHMVYRDLDGQYYGHERSWRWLLDKPFVWKSEKRINKYLVWNCFIGWKVSRTTERRHRAMIANRIAIKIRKVK